MPRRGLWWHQLVPHLVIPEFFFCGHGAAGSFPADNESQDDQSIDYNLDHKRLDSLEEELVRMSFPVLFSLLLEKRIGRVLSEAAVAYIVKWRV